MPDDVPEDAGAVVAAPAADPLARDAANAWNAAAAAARGLFSALPVSDDELFVELMLALLRFVLRCATFRPFYHVLVPLHENLQRYLFGFKAGKHRMTMPPTNKR